MKKLLTLAILTLLSGCASYTYIKPGATQAENAKDKLYCDQYVMQSIVAKGGAGDGVRRAYEEVFTYDRCMKTLGYSEVAVK